MSTRKSSAFYGLLIGFTSLVVGMVLASRFGLTPLSVAGPLEVPPTNSAPILGPIDTTTFRTIAHDAGPSVVSITARGPRSASADVPDLFDVFPPNLGGRRGRPPVPREETKGGSGFIIDKAGHILTNNHVVEGATSIEVFLASSGEREYGLPAKVIGRDELTDTALLQLTEMPSEPLTSAKFGDSAQMAPGDWVMAIGSPFNLSNTVTVGVVSAVGRPQAVALQRSEEFIQTDAAINSGNSGGPLLNVRGEVIGINTMIITNGASQGNLGIGFAVPINTVRDLLPQLHEGKVTRGRIAVEVMRRPMDAEYAKELGLPRPGGAEISNVLPGGPAEKAGIRTGDVIIEFNGKAIADNNQLVRSVTATKPGTTVPLKVVRDKKTISLNVTVGELDLAEEQRAVAGPDEPEQPRGVQPQDTGIGMDVQELTPRLRREYDVPAGRGGAIVTDVEPFGIAANGNILPEDVILAVQGQAVRSADEVTEAISRLPTGRTARILVWRGGREVLAQIRKR
jgi:serine protease Do